MDYWEPASGKMVPLKARPQPYASWTLDEKTLQWSAPFPPTNDKCLYQWDEKLSDWVKA